ncbi:MAG: Hpt domain-containing protein [Rhodobacteraceae bacterium]|nr:Hpt domain-containing protein [Paracoccaceae bacterium]
MTQSPIDSAVFTELQETVGADFVAELVGTFLDEAPGMIAELRSAHAVQDADGFRRAAHSIKSNANVFGAQELATAAKQLELGGLDAGGSKAFGAVDAACDEVTTALKALTDA